MRLLEPLRIGWESAQANLVPMLVLQGMAAGLVVTYLFCPSVREVLDPVASFHCRYGWISAFTSQALFCGILPGLFQLTIAVIRPPRPYLTIFAQATWCGLFGIGVNELFKAFAACIGNDVSVSTLVLKTAIDQFVWTALVIVPANSFFALITHNHGDHYTEAFYAAMNGAGKTVVSNFKDNYGTKDWRRDGGYTRAVKTFRIRDVEVTTGLTDHNDYLVDFTSTFEIKSHGFVIYHTGDCSSLAKLNPSATPDLWCVHPRCGLKPAAAVKKFSPKLTAVLHLNEMAHDVNRWRWTWRNGLSEKDSVEAVGGRAVVPVWGERIV